MDQKLLNKYSTSQLLDKFGAGHHKPGSGSAAALQGLLSAQLIRTVIDLSTDEKRRDSLKDHQEEFLKIKAEIESRIYPELEQFLQQDSEQFDKTIKLRIARDNEINPERKREFAKQALEELKPATEIPIKIARLCAELAQFATFIFDHGFKSVRGDSGVALNGAISAIGGCLSIIDLNLLSFTSTKWAKGITEDSNQIRETYNHLVDVAKTRLDNLKIEVRQKQACYDELIALISSIKDESKLSYPDLEEIARRLQNTLWLNRDILWKKNPPDDPLQILNPKNALITLGYHVDQPESLGRHRVQGVLYEIAGVIDKPNKAVSISKKFPPEIRNFTMAHELGHALLHKQSVLHRDRPLDGTSTNIRDAQELQADKFASYFLMPKKQVEAVFKELFLLKKFIITDDSVFALNQKSVSEFREKCHDLRGLARFIAAAELFQGRTFQSLAKIFKVSIETMAIRLEELELVEF
ncbi:MAG: cyclodeaminase/cyclohydrolase family protein [Cyclobacteriaceae bacterium]|nr:cyclodeaminase/cyclohydrolase family protein [Cyclobacteriaceae bacterium]